MATSNVELIKGTRGVKQWRGPNEFTDVIVVNGLTNPSGSTFKALEDAAITAAGLTLGDEHSARSYHYLRRIETKLVSTTECRIFATYRGYPFTEKFVEIIGSTNIKRVNVDKDSNDLTLTRPTDLSDDGEDSSYIEDAVKLAPQTVVRLKTIGFSPGGTTAQKVEESIDYTGKLNSNTYLGQTARKWLCTRYVLVEWTNGDYPWTRIVELQFDPDGWDVVKSYRKNNGKVYHTQDANSSKTFQLQGEATFSSLWY